jgi:UrcA family protein
MNNWFSHKQLLAVLFCTIFSVPAIAAIPNISTTGGKINAVEENTVTVSFADLDLSKQTGVESLYSRLKTAAKQACRSHSRDFRSAGTQRLWKQCYTETLSSAVQSINNEKIAYLHANAK